MALQQPVVSFLKKKDSQPLVRRRVTCSLKTVDGAESCVVHRKASLVLYPVAGSSPLALSMAGGMSLSAEVAALFHGKL